MSETPPSSTDHPAGRSVVDLAERSQSALAAAVAAGRDLGLEVTEPKVLHDFFSVVVHLAPAPVVARVPLVLSASLAEQAARQRTELDVTRWLSDRGCPVVSPSPLVPLEPVERDGFSMTFWLRLDEDPEVETDFVRTSARLPALHAAMRDYPGDLPFLSPLAAIGQRIEELAELPELLAPADLDRVRREWEFFSPMVSSREGFAAAFPDVPVQPIHGDAPAYNVIHTRTGTIHSDFEDPTIGPVECDLALIGPECAAAYDAAAAELGMRTLDPRVLATMNAVGRLAGVTALTFATALPRLAEELKPMVDAWRAAPFADGLA